VKEKSRFARRWALGGFPIFLAILLAGGAGPAGALTIDGDRGEEMALFSPGELVDFKIKAEAGAKMWVVLEAPSIFPGTVFARPGDAYVRENGAGYLVVASANGVPVEGADGLFYTASSESDRMDLGLNSLDGLGDPVIVTSLKGESLSRAAVVQSIVLTSNIATMAYIYGYAPVVVARISHDQTHSTSESAYAPVNRLYIDTRPATPEDALVVTPNVNVLYSSAHLDLSSGPVVLHTPSIQERYFSWQFMDAYTNDFHYIGTRATGGVEGTYVLTGPGWSGDIPSAYVPIPCPTNSVWLLGRHEVAPGSPSDMDAAVSLVRRSVLLPLDAYEAREAGYTNPLVEHPEDTVPPLDVGGLNFFEVLNRWLTANPPPSEDDSVLRRLAEIGVGPGFATDFQALPDGRQLELMAGIAAGSTILELEGPRTGALFNGWLYKLGEDFGKFGTNYLLRALVAESVLAANVVEESVYPLALYDQDLLPLIGSRRYTITFAPHQLPVPVNEQGFWSVTLYDRETKGLVANPLNRYALGSQDEDRWVRGPDGSLTIYIQRDSPGPEKESNWLPAPAADDPFYLIFRAYYPEEEMFAPADGPEYVIPQLTRVSGE